MATEKLKIAQVIGNAAIGGVSSCVFNYYKYIDKSKVTFDFYTYGECAFDDKIRAVCPDARIFYIPNVIRFYKAIPALTARFKAEKYDIVHSHMTTLSAFVLKAAKNANVPVRICHSHSAANKYADHKLVKDVLKNFAPKYATHFFACGEDAAKYLFGKRYGESYILKNAIELERFSYRSERDAAKAELGLCGKVIGFIGRFAYQKNLFFLIDAFSLAAKADDNLTLALLGSGDDEKKLKAYVKEKDLCDKVKFFAPTANTELFYAAFDAFALPSRYEGLPVVAIEAQAAGVPCVFSDRITKECSYTSNNLFLPLETSVWANAFKNISAVESKKSDTINSLINAGYDIRVEAKKLTDYYIKIGDKSL